MKRVARVMGIYACLWLPALLLYTGALVIQGSGRFTVARALSGALITLSVPMAAGAGSWWLSARMPWRADRVPMFLGVHALLALAFAAGWTTWIWSLMSGSGAGRGDLGALARFIMPWQAITGFFLYLVMAGIAYAVRTTLGVRDLRLTAERAERMRAQAELAALRAHIDPHFLFNTLHSVTQLLRGEPERAEAALERVADLFRYTLRLDRHHVEEVTVEDEWEFVESYLWLEALRMGDRLRVLSHLDDEALACAVPPFTLQPLVENAVRHGLAPRPDGGTVWVTAEERDGVLHLEVADDGLGASVASADGTGLGVRAVTQRLEARHGANAHLETGMRPGGGFRVHLTLPAVAARRAP